MRVSVPHVYTVNDFEFKSRHVTHSHMDVSALHHITYVMSCHTFGLEKNIVRDSMFSYNNHYM